MAAIRGSSKSLLGSSIPQDIPFLPNVVFHFWFMALPANASICMYLLIQQIGI